MSLTKFTVDPKRSLIKVEAIVNGKGPFNFVIDTGASHSIVSTQTAERLGLVQGAAYCGSSQGRNAQGAGGPVTARSTTIESLRVGDTEVRDIEIAIIDLANVSTAMEHKLDGIIGQNFMRDYRVIIDYPKQEVHFEKHNSDAAVRRV